MSVNIINNRNLNKTAGKFSKPPGGITEEYLSEDITQKLEKVDIDENVSTALGKKIDEPTTATEDQVLTYKNNKWVADDGGSGSVLVTATLTAGNEEIIITPPSGKESLFKNDNALYVPIFEPTELDSEGKYKVLTCVHEIVDTTNGRITITVAEAPTVNTRVGIQVTDF